VKENDLTKEIGYYAAFIFLEIHYGATESNDIGALLGMMNMFTMSGMNPPDGYIWDSWVECIKKVLILEPTKEYKLTKDHVSLY
jgi:hypothetical protein